jgi:hypothetical protein
VGSVSDVPESTERVAVLVRSLDALGSAMAEVLEDFAEALETTADLARAHARRRGASVDGSIREIECQRERRARAYAHVARTNARALSRRPRVSAAIVLAPGIELAPRRWRTEPMFETLNNDSHEDRERALARRDEELARRERRAAWSDGAGDHPDRSADKRVLEDDAREDRADKREGTAAAPERERLERQAQAEARRHADADREQAQIDREVAASQRNDPPGHPTAKGGIPEQDARPDRP